MIEQTGQSPALEPGSSGRGSAEFDADEASALEYSENRHSFETLLEDICNRLQETKQQGSLKRIRQLEVILDLLEKELDELSSGLPYSEQK